MKVLIIGAGALGIGIGATIKNSGVDVDFFARGRTKEAIAENGVGRTGWFSDLKIPKGQVGVYDRYEELPKDAYDYVIISTKTLANEEVSEKLYEHRQCMKKTGCIVFMQNGMGYEEPFLRYFEKEKIYHSRVITGFKKNEANESVVTAHQAPVLIGSLYGCPNEIVEPLAKAINDSGIPAQTDTEIEKALWAKLLYNTTLNPLGAVLGMSYGQLADSEYAHAIMDILIEEAFEIMTASGGNTYWDNPDAYRAALFGDMIPVTYEHRSSTLQDIERRQKTEIDFLTGSLLNLASRYNVAAPVHSMMFWLVKAMEENF